MLTVASVIRAAHHQVQPADRSPTATAIATANAKSPATPISETLAAAAASGGAQQHQRGRVVEQALALQHRDHARRDAEAGFTMVVATASVGLMIAPSAIPVARSMPGDDVVEERRR